MSKFLRSVYFNLLSVVGRRLARDVRTLYRIGDALGFVRNYVGYVGPRRSRRVYLDYMARALPDTTLARRRRILMSFWQNHEKNALELFLIPRLTPANVGDYVDFEGINHLDAALAAGKGAVIAPPHFGNERLLHIALALRGYPLTVMTSAFDDAPENLRRARLEPAGRLHELVFPSDHPRRLYEALGRNRVVQFSPTAAGGTSGVWCRCFGYELYVNTAPARLALRTGATLLPAFIYRLADNRHRVVIEPPLNDANYADPDTLTAQLIARIESRVRDDPDQFYWMWLVIRVQEAEAAGKNYPL